MYKIYTTYLVMSLVTVGYYQLLTHISTALVELGPRATAIDVIYSITSGLREYTAAV